MKVELSCKLVLDVPDYAQEIVIEENGRVVAVHENGVRWVTELQVLNHEALKFPIHDVLAEEARRILDSDIAFIIKRADFAKEIVSFVLNGRKPSDVIGKCFTELGLGIIDFAILGTSVDIEKYLKVLSKSGNPDHNRYQEQWIAVIKARTIIEKALSNNPDNDAAKMICCVLDQTNHFGCFSIAVKAMSKIDGISKALATKSLLDFTIDLFKKKNDPVNNVLFTQEK